MKKKTVFVGMSGGVDSSVSATLLKKQGFDVVGVFIKTWHPDFIKCNEEEERRDAMRVAAHLDIPFLTFDLEKEYKKEVADYMIQEYKIGRTPNPDVMCNKEVKFGAFFKKAISMGADYVATGHYAQNFSRDAKNAKKLLSRFSHSSLNMVNEFLAAHEAESTSLHFLAKAVDTLKDQVYFLWTLKQEQLSKILFPVGHLNKTEVRKLAKKFKLPVAEKKDSQGICFLGAVDLKEFLKHYIKEKKGKVVDENGDEIGYHNGVVFYTLGERHGFTITQKSPNDKPYYVVGKDTKRNTITVSQFPIPPFNKLRVPRDSRDNSQFPNNFQISNVIKIKDTNWISSFSPKAYGLEPRAYSCQIRYHGEFLPCKIKNISKTKAEGPERSRRAEVIFQKPILVASGQSCVIYDKDICLGGGVVE